MVNVTCDGHMCYGCKQDFLDARLLFSGRIHCLHVGIEADISLVSLCHHSIFNDESGGCAFSSAFCLLWRCRGAGCRYKRYIAAKLHGRLIRINLNIMQKAGRRPFPNISRRSHASRAGCIDCLHLGIEADVFPVSLCHNSIFNDESGGCPFSSASCLLWRCRGAGCWYKRYIAAKLHGRLIRINLNIMQKAGRRPFQNISRRSHASRAGCIDCLHLGIEADVSVVTGIDCTCGSLASTSAWRWGLQQDKS